MIRVKSGNIFDSNCYWLVCPVNCVPGVMGAGLAKQFCFNYSPAWMKHKHVLACDSGMSVGNVFLLRGCTDRIARVHGIVLFPTKDHWKNKSKIEWIVSGLASMSRQMIDRGARIAFPPLGCGLGGLSESDVFPLIEEFSSKHDCEYYKP